MNYRDLPADDIDDNEDFESIVSEQVHDGRHEEKRQLSCFSAGLNMTTIR